MKNLIDEIKQAKLWSGNTAYSLGSRETIDKVLELLDQYNIITAPKTIKLSELIDKIYKTEHSGECYVKAIKCSNGQYKDDYRIHIKYGDGYWGDYEFYIVKGKINSSFNTDLPKDEFEWLYTLWIAGTTIIDDLGDDENE